MKSTHKKILGWICLTPAIIVILLVIAAIIQAIAGWDWYKIYLLYKTSIISAIFGTLTVCGLFLVIDGTIDAKYEKE